jgi:hypothetical protein
MMDREKEEHGRLAFIRHDHHEIPTHTSFSPRALPLHRKRADAAPLGFVLAALIDKTTPAVSGGTKRATKTTRASTTTSTCKR